MLFLDFCFTMCTYFLLMYLLLFNDALFGCRQLSRVCYDSSKSCHCAQQPVSLLNRDVACSFSRATSTLNMKRIDSMPENQDFTKKHFQTQQCSSLAIYTMPLDFSSMSGVGLLAHRVAEIRHALQENRRCMRQCEQQCRRMKQRTERGGLTARGVKRVLAVYALSSWKSELAMQVAQQLTKLTRDHPAYPSSGFVQKLFLAAEETDLLSMHDGTNAEWVLAMKFARVSLAEYEAFSWVRNKNLLHGSAPSVTQVFERFQSQILHAGPSNSPRPRAVRKWAAGWRQRWGVRRARLRAADHLDPTALRDKAGKPPKF